MLIASFIGHEMNTKPTLYCFLISLAFLCLCACASVKSDSADEAKVLAYERTNQLIEYSKKVHEAIQESTKDVTSLSDVERLMTVAEAKTLNVNLQEAITNVSLYTALVAEWEKTGKKPPGIDLANTRAVFGLSLIELQLNGEKLYDSRDRHNYNFSGYRINSAP